MNIAEALVGLGNGCYEWREDLSPQLMNPLTGNRGPSLLTFELLRMPLFRVGMLKFRTYTNQLGTFTGPRREYRRPCTPSSEYRKRQTLSPQEKEAVALAQIKVLEETEDKLSFEQICQRAGCPFNQTTRGILQAHIKAKRVDTEGRRRAARYWARRAR